MKSFNDKLTFSSGHQMKNRFMLAPLTNTQSHEDGVLSDDEYNWLTKRAQGGFGLTMSCASHVQDIGKGFPGQLGIFDDKHINGLMDGKLGKLAKEQENKNGVLLFFKHSLHLELDTRILAMNCDIYGIEREHNSPEFELLQKTGRLKSMKGITDRKNTFTFIRINKLYGFLIIFYS